MQDTPGPRRLNPFALPDETAARFNLLVVAAATIVFNLGVALVIKLFLGAFSGLAVSGFGLLQRQEIDAQQALSTLFSLPFCSGFLILLLLASASWRYHRHPLLIRRKQHLRPSDSQKDSRLLQAVEELAQGVGVSTLPQISLGPEGVSDGQAFGLARQPELRLGNRANCLRLKQPERFRALILHELAHLANRDVGRSYFAEAVWKVFLVLIVPLVIVIAAAYGIAYIRLEIPTGGLDWLITLTGAAIVIAINGLIQAVEFGVLIWIVALIRRGALRTREMYADWRAAQWGARQGLEEILSEATHRPRLSWWRRLLRFHPSPLERLQALKEPDYLFQIFTDLPASTGFLMGYLIAGGTPILGAALAILKLGFSDGQVGSPLLAASVLLVLFGYLAASLAAAGFVTGTLGLQLGRAAAADLASGQGGRRAYLKLGRPALLFALAFELGVLAMPYDTITVVPLLTAKTTLAFLLLPLWVVLLAITLWVWMAYLRFFALRLMSVATGAQPPQSKLTLLNLATTLLLPLLCLPAAATRLPLVGYTVAGWVLVAAPLLSLVILGGFWGLSWAGITWLGSQTRCPICGKNTCQQNVLVERCEHCHGELATWLYTEA